MSVVWVEEGKMEFTNHHLSIPFGDFVKISRSARFYVYTKTDTEDDIDLMAKWFDNLREVIRID